MANKTREQEDQHLGIFLRDLPHEHDYKYTTRSDQLLRETLFRSLVGRREDRLKLLFPNGPPSPVGAGGQGKETWKLREAQGAVEGAEYTEAARGHPCGHIFKNGESSYHCRTCAADDTCVLCARCFAASDHEGHILNISVSSGNGGCCDCADEEAWVGPLHCNIHSAMRSSTKTDSGKSANTAALPEDLVEVIRMTIGRAIDFLCDVLSCAPEQLRLPKTEASIRRDELSSRLSAEQYGGPEQIPDPVKYSAVLWNDEKHTLDDVSDKVARACTIRRSEGAVKAHEVNDIGRSILTTSSNLADLLRTASILEQSSLTVTIRSARDIFRELMCETIIDWISDISGCSFGPDPQILRATICTEMLQAWRGGAQRPVVEVGEAGIHDHENEDKKYQRQMMMATLQNQRGIPLTDAEIGVEAIVGDSDLDDEDEDEEAETGDLEEGVDGEVGAGARRVNDILNILQQNIGAADMVDDAMDLEDENGDFIMVPGEDGMNLDIDEEMEDTANETMEATMAGYPAPPPPPPAGRSPSTAHRQLGREADNGARASPHSTDSAGEASARQASRRVGAPGPSDVKLPKTPSTARGRQRRTMPAGYWLEQPRELMEQTPMSPAEDLFARVRLDYLILYDLRLWKTLRIALRDLYIGTVVTLADFKRILGLRFASMYTLLAQLYLIADREPDHSIINLSLQILTTPSITAEVVDRGNFLTNLMAILYTFLTTRQVGFPSDVNPQATLAFDSGAISNRRMFHFFVDLRYMLQSTLIRDKVRQEPRYLLQFLDLVKLHQGICPNVRAVGEHVEYEADAWFSALMVIKEINKLCRQVADSFSTQHGDNLEQVRGALRATAQTALINSFGLERQRFVGAENKKELRFHLIQFADGAPTFSVPDFQVAREPMSFHHPLHYLLSWLLEAGVSLTREDIRAILAFDVADIKYVDPVTSQLALTPTYRELTPDELICGLFDPPLRVCSWIAQMRAGMWVRNGMTLRHQMHNYRGTTQRDVSFQRDIFLVQAGLVLCGRSKEAIGERYFAQMVDRYGLTSWTQSMSSSSLEDSPPIDVIEDFFHLLVIVLSERQDLSPKSDYVEAKRSTMQREIAHVLCFKPLSFSDITQRLTDKVADDGSLDQVLKDMTIYRAPEGLNDSGTFELKPKYIPLVDPYYAFYTRNQREEAETLHKKYISGQTGVPETDVIYDPQLATIGSGLFVELAAFTRSKTFHQVLLRCFGLATRVSTVPPAPASRVETVLHLVLHLVLVTIGEDDPDRPFSAARSGHSSFVEMALTRLDSNSSTLIESLSKILDMQEYASCHSKIRLILQRIEHRQPALFATAMSSITTKVQLPAPSAVQDSESKRKHALERQARVMAQFKQQQSSFMETQGLDWDVDDFSDADDGDQTRDPDVMETEEKTRDYPKEPCMLCQEDTGDGRLYGAFAFISQSRILRHTDLLKPEMVAEVVDTPTSLDRSAEAVRPFGVASKDKGTLVKTLADESTVIQENEARKGFADAEPGIVRNPVATSCGHIMHFSCFEAYLTATSRRHQHQIARNHPERLAAKEFLCPLCKALGNVFLPLVWKGRKESYPGVLARSSLTFEGWLRRSTFLAREPDNFDDPKIARQLQRVIVRREHEDYLSERLVPSLAANLVRKAEPETDRQDVHRSQVTSLMDVRSELLGRAPNEANAPGPVALAKDELRKAYVRLEDSMAANHVTNEGLEVDGQKRQLGNFVSLSAALSSSISAVEIAYRGVAATGNTCLATIPEQVLTNLRILSETATTYIAVAVVTNSNGDRTNDSLHSDTALYSGNEHDYDLPNPFGTGAENDIFTNLANSSILLESSYDDNPTTMDDVIHLMRLHLVAEVVNTIGHATACRINDVRPDRIGRETYPAVFGRMVRSVDSESKELAIRRVDSKVGEVDAMDLFDEQHGFAGDDGYLERPGSIGTIWRVCNVTVLTFLRKCLILMHVRFGVDFDAAQYAVSGDQPELNRLATLLQLPNLEEVCEHYVSYEPSAVLMRRAASLWIEEDNAYFAQLRGHTRLIHPAIFELVDLPRTYDTLTEEATKHRCPTTGKDLTDPVICLFCGAIFCGQAGCCTKDGKGGCNQHLIKCGGKVGMFLNIRKCMVLLLHEGHGSWFYAPYLDKHGEVDPTLRRHHQLFLNQKRYDKLFREVWLFHGIPSAISRRLEGDMNYGGWETL